MLAYILALAVGLGSLALYIAAFFFPEVHRKNDFIWSGVGLFYALVLWVCAGRITGGVLLGQISSVALLGWLGWEMLKLRREMTPATQQTEIPSPQALQEKLASLSIPEKATSLFTTVKDQAQETLGGLLKRTGKIEPEKIKQPSIADVLKDSPDEKTIETEATVTSAVVVVSAEEEDEEMVVFEVESPELVRPHPPDPELVEAALEDAQEKHLSADPPETTAETSAAKPESENPPNPT